MASSNTTPTTITLISGANTGLGLAIATRLAKEHGHHVIIGSRNADAGAQVASSLRAEGFAASSVQLDVDSDESIGAAAQAVEDEFGRLDVLVNNAGILLDLGHDPKLPTRELFARTLSTNVSGTACLTEAVLPLLRRSELPRVVFVSSRMGSLAYSRDPAVPWYGVDYKAYDASKAAVHVLALNYARILADAGGRVNVVCPGLVNTNLGGGITSGTSPYVGATQAVKMATVGKDGPTATFTAQDGVMPW
ncbi:hypothetical protein F4778DRAFT_294978 [Xylariomycetidae sp. FL2044]|nr:hypothetical protein F4778DRAFT_294978 [Xylariomycetidae sp. FL2044]